MKKLTALLIITAILLSTPSYLLAENENVLTWQKAYTLLNKNSSVLSDLSEAEQERRKQYEEASAEAKNIDTKGRTINILGNEIRIGYDEATQMLMTQQKELYPEQMRFYWNVSQDTLKGPPIHLS